MDLESLVDAQHVFSVGMDNAWSFIFTMIFAAVGFLATLRQVFSEDHRSQARYKTLVRVVQIFMLVFVVNGIITLGDLSWRLNAVMASIQDKAISSGEKELLISAFQPYIFKPDWLLSACPAEYAKYCDHYFPISLIVFAPASIILILVLPMIAGFHPKAKS